MSILLATKSSTPVIGQLASLMGFIMDGIYRFLNGLFGIQNLGLCIIIFSIIIYLLMTPLQIKQQKFSKLSSIMQPELQAVQKKYKGKRDQESMQRMNEETQAVYHKYGTSPSGSCVQLAIQFPILMALWQVIYRIPAYVGSVRDVFSNLVAGITKIDGFIEILQTFISENKMGRVALSIENEIATDNSVIDFLYSLSTDQWEALKNVKEFSGLADTISKTASDISPMQSFLKLNIANQPLGYIMDFFQGNGPLLLAIIAVMIPVLAWATQVANIKLMPQQSPAGAEEAGTMAGSMKTMNTVMPIMSAVFCFTFPVGMGIYWIASALVRSIQQVVINRHLDKIDMDELINENVKKMEAKRAKRGLPPQKITSQAHQSVKNLDAKPAAKGNSSSNNTSRAKKVEEAYNKARTAKPGSITAKANMVRDFDERNKKK